MTQAAVAESGLYERDFYAWTQEQAAALRRAASERVNFPLDWENVAEEIESLGKSDRRQIRSRLETLLEHLLKLATSTQEEPRRGWKLTIMEQRRRLLDVLEDSPSLASFPYEVLDSSYDTGRQRVALALDIDAAFLPAACPFSLESEILNPEWFPELRSQPNA